MQSPYNYGHKLEDHVSPTSVQSSGRLSDTEPRTIPPAPDLDQHYNFLTKDDPVDSNYCTSVSNMTLIETKPPFSESLDEAVAVKGSEESSTGCPDNCTERSKKFPTEFLNEVTEVETFPSTLVKFGDTEGQDAAKDVALVENAPLDDEEHLDEKNFSPRRNEDTQEIENSDKEDLIMEMSAEFRRDIENYIQSVSSINLDNMGIITCPDQQNGKTSEQHGYGGTKIAEGKRHVTLSNGIPPNHSKKRSLDDGDEDEDGDEAHRPPKEHCPPDRTNSNSRRLACPYFKRQPSQFSLTGNRRSCIGPGYPTIHRLREHLNRCHRRPVQCNRCQKLCDSEDERIKHLEDALSGAQECEESFDNVSVDDDAFSKEQDEQMKNLKAKGTNSEKWYEVYKILFPRDDHESLPSPYCEPFYPPHTRGDVEALSFNVNAKYEELYKRELPRIMQTAKEDLNKLLEVKISEFKSQASEIIHDGLIQQLLQECGPTCPSDGMDVTSPVVEYIAADTGGSELINRKQIQHSAPYTYSQSPSNKTTASYPGQEIRGHTSKDSGCFPADTIEDDSNITNGQSFMLNSNVSTRLQPCQAEDIPTLPSNDTVPVSEGYTQSIYQENLRSHARTIPIHTPGSIPLGQEDAVGSIISGQRSFLFDEAITSPGARMSPLGPQPPPFEFSNNNPQRFPTPFGNIYCNPPRQHLDQFVFTTTDAPSNFISPNDPFDFEVPVAADYSDLDLGPHGTARSFQ